MKAYEVLLAGAVAAAKADCTGIDEQEGQEDFLEFMGHLYRTYKGEVVEETPEIKTMLNRLEAWAFQVLKSRDAIELGNKMIDFASDGGQVCEPTNN